MSSNLLISFNLTYNLTHQILICLTCQYAIQPSAIPSHLLKHKIYRQEKSRLLTAISLLHLSDSPSPPLSNSKPVEGLEVITGLRCVAGECAYLCASEKRMRWHWSEAHAGGNEGVFEEGRRARIQTFFRGRGIRYFEVDGDGLAIERESEEGAKFGEVEVEVELKGSDMNTEMPDTNKDSDITALSPPIPLPTNVDLGILTYFHHFTTFTSSTLPSAENGYWGKTVISLALQQQNLMCGILAISAYHLSFLAEENSTLKLSHLERAKQWSISFFQTGEDERKEARREISLILHLAKSSLASSEAVELNPCEFITTIKLLSTPTLGSQTQTPPLPPPAPTSSSFASAHIHTSAQITSVQILRNLPHLIAQKFPNPSNSQAEHIFAILEAIRVLIVCCASSVGEGDEKIEDVTLFFGSELSGGNGDGQASGSAARKWQAMINWVQLVPERFLKLVERGDGAGLVVVCYWAAYLLKVIEDQDTSKSWFLKELASGIVQNARAILPPHVREIVEGLET